MLSVEKKIIPNEEYESNKSIDNSKFSYLGNSDKNVYIPILPHEVDATQGQFFMLISTSLNSEFSFFQLLYKG